MAGWTKWRKVAERTVWYPDVIDSSDPACYELALGGPRGGIQHIVYVGETANERARIAAYARDGSHLAGIIRGHLRKGFSLYYRAQKKASKQAAKRMQDDLLRRYDYDWNLMLPVGT